MKISKRARLFIVLERNLTHSFIVRPILDGSNNFEPFIANAHLCSSPFKLNTILFKKTCKCFPHLL